MIWQPKRNRYDSGLYIFVCALAISYIMAFYCLYVNHIDDMSEVQVTKICEAPNWQAVYTNDIAMSIIRQTKSPLWEDGLPVIYFITPTFSRLEQKADLTRLSYTLMHVKNLVWIIIEDSDRKTDLVRRFLKETTLYYVHLNIRTPPELQMQPGMKMDSKPRGTRQRNYALDWLRSNVDYKKAPGVVYFGDDDNTYSIKLFDEMRFSKKVSVWPVGLVGGAKYGQPHIKDGKVIGWFAVFKPYRPFAVDMAGFAVNLRLFHEHPESGFNGSVEQGFQESSLLQSLQISLDDFDPKADMCTEILVWHTRTVQHKLLYEDKMKKKYANIQPYPTLEV